MNKSFIALHLADTAYQLATKIIRHNKDDGIPTRSGVMTAMGTIPRFNAVYSRIEIGDDGPIFVQGDYNKINLYGQEYDRLADDALLANDTLVRGNLTGIEVTHALGLIMREREDKDYFFRLDEPQDEDDRAEFADWLANRMIYVGRQAYNALRGARRGIYPAFTQCAWSDFVAVLETQLEAVDADDGYTPESNDVADSFDSGEDILTLLKNTGQDRVQLVEYDHIAPALHAAADAWTWLQHFQAESVAQSAFEQALRLARERLEQSKAQRLTIGTKSRSSAA